MESVVGSQDNDSDVPINSLVTPNKRRRKRRRKSTTPESTPGAPELDCKSLVEDGIIKLPEKQQWLVPQRDDLSFDYSELPCNYISLPVEKFFKLFEKFKYRKCHTLKQKVFTVERFGWAQTLYYKCMNCNDTECVRANLTGTLEKTWAEAPCDKNILRTKQHNCVSSADFERNIQV
jgi:hypothetical protein